MRLRGPWLIGQAHLATSVTSQWGTLPGLPALGVLLAFSSHSFVWACKVEIPGSTATYHPMIGFPPLSVDADVPELLLTNGDNIAQLYAAEWRHVNP